MDRNAEHLTCDAILFDLDGVLIDSTRCIIRHWQEWAERHALDLSEILRVAHGIRTIETMRHVAPHLDVEREAAQFTAHEVADTDGVVAIGGATQILNSLPVGAWAVVTSGSSALARARLRQAGLPIPPILVTADNVTRGKPDPEPYLIGAQRLGVAAKRCVVVEDAPAGIEAGHKAGMRVIGIQATHTREVLLEKGADIVIEQLTQLHIRETVQKNRLVIHVN
jgi:sugar-phosphatase